MHKCNKIYAWKVADLIFALVLLVEKKLSRKYVLGNMYQTRYFERMWAQCEVRDCLTIFLYGSLSQVSSP